MSYFSFVDVMKIINEQQLGLSYTRYLRETLVNFIIPEEDMLVYTKKLFEKDIPKEILFFQKKKLLCFYADNDVNTLKVYKYEDINRLNLHDARIKEGTIRLNIGFTNGDSIMLDHGKDSYTGWEEEYKRHISLIFKYLLNK